MSFIKNFRKRFPFIYYSIILTPILAFAVLITGGAGHGVSIFIKFFYPYSVLLMLVSPEHSTREIIFIIGTFIYIIYGIILNVAERKGKLKNAVLLIGVLHFTAFISLLLLYPLPFP